jgi:DNA-directed RNA polymerase subunit RPC12/RpoP
MHRFHHSPARTSDLPRSVAGDNLNYCGIECPSCGYQLRLSDRIGGVLLLDIFRADALTHAVDCPECGISTNFARSNLKLFARQGED